MRRSLIVLALVLAAMPLSAPASAKAASGTVPGITGPAALQAAGPAAATTVSTPSTGGWDTIGSVTVNLTLNAGSNTIRLGNATGWAPDLDRITLT